MFPRNLVTTHRYVYEEDVYLDVVKEDLLLPLDEGKILPLFSRVGGSMLKLPRNYHVPWKIPAPREDRRVEATPPFPSLPVRSLVQLRENQTPEVLSHFGGEGVVSLACGRGKTVLAIHAIVTNQEFPALIVAHTEVLAEQWRAEIKLHTGLTDADIGTLRGGTVDVRDKPFSIAILNSVALKEYPKWVYDYFRRVVFDEVHKCGAEKLGLAAGKFLGKRLGLSATWERPDGLHRVYLAHIGPVLHEDTEDEMKATVVFYHTRFRVTERGSGKRDPTIVKALTINALARKEDRNRVIVEQVDKAVRAGRTVLVLGERREHLRLLCERTECEEKGLLLGSQATSKAKKAAELAENQRVIREARVIYATSRVADTGFSRVDLDTVFVLFPFANPATFAQVVGRELRRFQGKKDPLVVVFVDDVVLPILGSKPLFGYVPPPAKESSSWMERVGKMEEIALDRGYSVRKVIRGIERKGGRDARNHDRDPKGPSSLKV